MAVGRCEGGRKKEGGASLVGRSSADPCVAARHVIGGLLDLSHISWRACVADLLADHSYGWLDSCGWLDSSARRGVKGPGVLGGPSRSHGRCRSRSRWYGLGARLQEKLGCAANCCHVSARWLGNKGDGN